jgi:hypothetical protein
MVSYNGDVQFLRDSDVIASDSDRRRAHEMYLRGQSAAASAVRALHFGLKKNQRWVIVKEVTVREAPSTNGSVVATLFRDQKVYLDKESSEWARVAYRGPFDELRPERKFESLAAYDRACSFGWVHASELTSNPPELQARIHAEVEEAAAVDTRRQSFVASHPELPPDIRRAIASGRIVRGMSPEMVRAAIGEPLSINRSVGGWGVNEQWIYSALYVYLDNEVLTSWQEFGGR